MPPKKQRSVVDDTDATHPLYSSGDNAAQTAQQQQRPKRKKRRPQQSMDSDPFLPSAVGSINDGGGVPPQRRKKKKRPAATFEEEKSLLPSEPDPMPSHPLFEIEESRKSSCWEKIRPYRCYIWIGGIGLIVVGAVLLIVFLLLPSSYSCIEENSDYYVVYVPNPKITKSDPLAICNAENIELVLTGTNFIKYEDTLPTLTSDGQECDVLKLDDCIDLQLRGHSAYKCTTMLARVHFKVELNQYISEFVVTNPTPKASPMHPSAISTCSGTSRVTTVFPTPTITDIVPPVLCADQSVISQFSVVGSYFVQWQINEKKEKTEVFFNGNKIPGETQLTLSECTPINAPGFVDFNSCNRITTDMYYQGNPSTIEKISVSNMKPLDCASETFTVFSVQRPTIDPKPQAELKCVNDGSGTLELTGTNFVSIDGVGPTVLANDVESPTTANNCKNPIDFKPHSARLCSTINAKLNPDMAKTEIYRPSISVYPKDASSCSSDPSEYIISVMPMSQIFSLHNDSPTKSTICVSDGAFSRAYKFDGLFVEVPSAGATISVSAKLNENDLTSHFTKDNCYDVSDGVYSSNSCKTMDITLDNIKSDGEIVVRLANLCNSYFTSVLYALPAAVPTAFEPFRICPTTENTVKVVGDYFSILNNGTETVKRPTVEINGKIYDTFEPDDCTKYDRYLRCKSVKIKVPTNELAIGDYNAIVRNVGTDGSQCEPSKFVSISAVSVPKVSSISGDRCAYEDVVLEITGEGLSQYTAFELYQNNDSSNRMKGTFESISTDGKTVTSRFSYPSKLVPGTYTLFVENAPGCEITDKSHTVNLISNDVEAYSVSPSFAVVGRSAVFGFNVGKFNGNALSGVMRPSAVNLRDFIIPLKVSKSPFADYSYFEATADIPSNAPIGEYDIELKAPSTCSGHGLKVHVLENKYSDGYELTVGQTQASVSKPLFLRLTLKQINDKELPSAENEIPYVFLSLTQCEDSCKAFYASSTTILSDLSSATLRVYEARFDKLPESGDYSVVLESSTGSNADSSLPFTAPLLLKGTSPLLIADEDSLMIISSVYPTLLESNGNRLVRISGKNFKDVPYEIIQTCEDKVVQKSDSVSFESPNLLNAILPEKSTGSICRFSLTRQDGMNAFASDVISYVSSFNYISQSVVSKFRLPTKVCAPATAMWTNAFNKFLYIIGGSASKTCASNMPLNTVQMAPLDFYGAGSGSVVSTTSLPKGFTGISATVVGSYIITVGGFDGTNLASVYTSHILQPCEAPNAKATYTLLTTGQYSKSIASGTYRYVVSAVFPSTHKTLPNAETLPSAEAIVTIPKTLSISGRLQAAFVQWEAIPNSSGYKVYRYIPDKKLFQLVKTISSGTILNYIDTGDTYSSVKPITLGTIGPWVLSSQQLNTNRYAATLLSKQLSTIEFKLFVFGGKNSQNAEMNSIETTQCSVMPAAEKYGIEELSVGGFTRDVRTTSALSDRQGVILDKNNMQGYASTSDFVLLLGPGRSNNNPTGPSEESYVSSGALQKAFTAGNPGHLYGGYCLFASSGYLYAFGGTSEAVLNDLSLIEQTLSEFMIIGTNPPPNENPFESTFDTMYGSPISAVAFSGCLSDGQLGFMIGGVDRNGLFDGIQRVGL